MTPAEIKAAMLKRGITQTEISIVLGKDASLVGKVINGKSTNLAIRQGVAEAIEKELTEVFPDEAYRRPSGRICKPSAYFQRAMASA